MKFEFDPDTPGIAPSVPQEQTHMMMSLGPGGEGLTKSLKVEGHNILLNLRAQLQLYKL